MLQLIIVADGVVSTGKQRRDAYYRNDPSKYGLDLRSKTEFSPEGRGWIRP